MKNFFVRISNFFEGMKESFLQGTMIAIIIACVFLIALITFLFIKKLLKDNSKDGVLPVILSTVFACILMIPATCAFSKLVRISVEKQIKNATKEEIARLQLEVKNQQLEKEALESKNKLVKQEIEMNLLNKQVSLLKSSQVSAMQFQKIAEVALLKTNIQQAKVWNGRLGDIKTGWGILASQYHDYALIVNTYDIKDAKFGIDFQDIKIKKIDDNHIIVAGIKTKYIGSPDYSKENIVKEIRTINYDSDNNIKSIQIKNDAASLREIDKLEEESNNEYLASLKNMENWTFLEDSIVTLGKNFIQVIFAPAYENIDFVEDAEDDSFRPLIDFISYEIETETEQANILSNVLSTVENAQEAQKVIDSEESKTLKSE